tara:strand:- start:114 stop:275 length:162 start_codon:yes stop_codon:yes gene_type:complete
MKTEINKEIILKELSKLTIDEIEEMINKLAVIKGFSVGIPMNTHEALILKKGA